jgi:hypothetical protein
VVWWPSRLNLDRREIEAESVAYIVTNHLGLKGSSAAYVSRHLKGGEWGGSAERVGGLHCQSRRPHQTDGDNQDAATTAPAAAKEQAFGKASVSDGGPMKAAPTGHPR